MGILVGGDAAVGLFLDRLRLPTIEVRLGDVGTSIRLPAARDTLRLSVGPEDLADLEADFTQALTRVRAVDIADQLDALR